MKRILGTAIGECVHTAGLYNFLSLAENKGIQTVFLGPAVPIQRLIVAIKAERPDVVALSYRLTDTSCAWLLRRLKEALSKHRLLDREYVFGGTTHTAQAARQSGIFRRVFDGTESLEEIETYLTGVAHDGNGDEVFPNTLVDRIDQKYPLPLIRHHVGRPSLEQTVEEVRMLAESKQLDVISLAPDQVSQESFFRPDEQAQGASGAGGAPVRTEEDLRRIYAASRGGNQPLMRCYSGTRDLLRWAEMLARTLHNAWAAIPVFWYNELDGRSRRPLMESIREAQQAIRWHGEKGIAVECNDSHQWSMRYAPDAVAVAAAYIVAYNAKRLGVKHYVSQYMMQTPAQISPAGDIAKMLAKMELIEGLHDESFGTFREVRPGIISFPADLDCARGHLGFATAVATVLKPHVFHVVAYSEGQYAAGAGEIIESVKMASHILRSLQRGFPADAITSDPDVVRRKQWLKEEAMAVIQAVECLGPEFNDPLVEPAVLTRAVEVGVLDTPLFKNRKPAKGKIAAACVDGNWCSVDPGTGELLPEQERTRDILQSLS